MKTTHFIPVMTVPADYTGYIRMDCTRGKHQAWIDPVVAEIVRELPPMEALCEDCALLALANNETLLPFGIPLEDLPEEFRIAAAHAASARKIMIGRRRAWFPDALPPESTTATCERCQETVVLKSENYLKTIEENIEIICYDCYEADGSAQDNTAAHVLMKNGEMSILSKEDIEVVRQINERERRIYNGRN